jgi:diguanylate cyclase (GGDEF)-like protein
VASKAGGRPRGAAGFSLWLVIGLLALLAVAAVSVAVHFVARFPVNVIQILFVLIALMVGNQTVVHIRLRSANIRNTLTSPALLFATLTMHRELVVLITAVGIGLAKVIGRQDLRRSIANTSREVLACAAAAFAVGLVGFSAPLTSMRQAAIALPAAAVAYALVDTIVGNVVLSLATGVSIRGLFTNYDIEFYVMLMKVALVYVAFVAYQINPILLIAMLPAPFMLRQAFSGRVRERAEREAWQKLAAVTDEFSRVDLSNVLSIAVDRAVDLFSADECEIQLNGDPEPARVRSQARAGNVGKGEAAYGTTITVPIADASTEFGRLRLLFTGTVQLNEREGYTLRTFASALSTAIRNANTHAQTQKLANINEFAATHDELTGLGNRRLLIERGNELLATRVGGGVAALLMLDLNHFKEINDTLGHETGDEVLKAVAHRLTAAAQDGAAVIRLGGDEFAVLLCGIATPALVMTRSRDLLTVLDPALDVSGLRIGVEACAGIAVADQGTGIIELLRRADVAMHQAKRSNTRLVPYTRTRDTADLTKLELGAALPRAVAEHEFVVEYQPIVDMGSGMVIGAEALTRWRHPDRGELDPRGFIDAIERSAVLPAFAEEILDQALVANTEWAEAGFPLPVAVNVSPRSLLDPGFLEMVSGRLAARGVAPNQLMLEVTESVALSQLSVVDEVLAGLQSLGVLIALDDFGTGFSSLATLARILVDEIKIDRSFVVEMDKPASAAVVRSTIELGRSLDLLVVAEGVEQEHQRRTLWELGCPAGQGHLFARPMPADRMLAALQRGFDGRPGALAGSLHTGAAVIRMPSLRRRGSAEDRRRAT